MMNTLLELQTAFDNAVFDNIDAGMHKNIVANGLAPDRRLKVYRNNVFHSLTQALKDVYPVVERLVGSDFFKYCAHNYIRENPSTTGNLHKFGKYLPEFLGALDSTRELVYLEDLAGLEWAYHVVFHAADAVPLNVQRLQAVAEENYAQIRFSLHPACCLMRSHYPVLKIWQSNQSDKQDSPDISLDEGGMQLAVLRNNLDIEFHTLTVAELNFLLACHQGVSFAQACDLAVDVDPEINISETLLSFIQKNIIADFTI